MIGIGSHGGRGANKRCPRPAAEGPYNASGHVPGAVLARRGRRDRLSEQDDMLHNGRTISHLCGDSHFYEAKQECGFQCECKIQPVDIGRSPTLGGFRPQKRRPAEAG